MAAPSITVADVQRLSEVLATAGAWMTAADLSVAIYGHETESTKRRVRATASAAGAGIVSFPGSPGYKLWKLCTVDELHACVAAYTSQADEMRRRRDLYRIRLHRETAVDHSRPSPLQPTREQLTFL